VQTDLERQGVGQTASRVQAKPVCAEDRGMKADQRHDSVCECSVLPRSEISVLVVHSDRHVRSYFRMLLRGVDVTNVSEAAETNEAVNHVGRLRPSIILVGLEAQDVPTVDIIRPFRAINPEAAVIAVSERTGPDFLAALAASDVLSHIPLRLVREEISEQLSSALEKFRLRSSTPCRLCA
jgi:DNA-binding NarL/FixJ family response regulator